MFKCVGDGVAITTWKRTHAACLESTLYWLPLRFPDVDEPPWCLPCTTASGTASTHHHQLHCPMRRPATSAPAQVHVVRASHASVALAKAVADNCAHGLTAPAHGDGSGRLAGCFEVTSVGTTSLTVGGGAGHSLHTHASGSLEGHPEGPG